MIKTRINKMKFVFSNKIISRPSVGIRTLFDSILLNVGEILNLPYRKVNCQRDMLGGIGPHNINPNSTQYNFGRLANKVIYSVFNYRRSVGADAVNNIRNLQVRLIGALELFLTYSKRALGNFKGTVGNQYRNPGNRNENAINHNSPSCLSVAPIPFLVILPFFGTVTLIFLCGGIASGGYYLWFDKMLLSFGIPVMNRDWRGISWRGFFISLLWFLVGHAGLFGIYELMANI